MKRAAKYEIYLTKNFFLTAEKFHLLEVAVMHLGIGIETKLTSEERELFQQLYIHLLQRGEE